VDVGREFGRVLDDLVAARREVPPGPPDPSRRAVQDRGLAADL
jgi:hypothetical protein